MQHKLVFVLLLIITLGMIACTPEEEVIETSSPEPTQTPFIQVVTATPSLTPVASLTPLPTVVPTTTVLPTQGILDRCVLRTDWETYQVEVGDTLSNISVRTNTTLTTLQLANCLPDANRIQVGQVLYVPQLPDDGGVLVEDIISEFNVNVTEAQAGDTVTFTWQAEDGTVIEIKNVTTDTVVGSSLSASGSLSYTLPSDLEADTELEFAITGLKSDDEDVLASPYSVFITIVDEPEATDEPEMTDEPEATDEPEITEEPEVTEES